jgi:streptomycin 6-kinase
MKNKPITIPDLVRQKVAQLGAEGLRWLDGLGDLIAELEQDWQITVGANLEGGSEAYVAQASTTDGSKVILKIAMPQVDGNTVLANEIVALTIAGGRGYVRLLRSDLSRRALLLEQLGVPLADLGYSSRTQIDIICKTLKEAWLPVTSESSLPNGASMAQWFSKFIADLWEQLGRPCSQQVVDRAFSFTRLRAEAFDPARAVLVHGDAHSGNTLQNLSRDPQTQASFKLIDPDGIVAEPAYDLGVLIRTWQDELLIDPVKLGQERCTYLSQTSGADRQAIWQWGFLQGVATGLFLVQMGEEQEGSQLLKVAEAWSKASSKGVDL